MEKLVYKEKIGKIYNKYSTGQISFIELKKEITELNKQIQK